MLRRIKADMHIHSCLSPCAELDMTPKGIVELSIIKGLDMIAVCDHNSAENAEAAMRFGKLHDLCVLPGMEICSIEEIHVLAIFGTIQQAVSMQEYVYSHLPGTNQPEHFGNQWIVNEEDEVLGENTRLLIGATTLKIHEIVNQTHALGGLSIASHADRTAFGIVSQLGFIPPDLNLDAVEVSWRMPVKDARTQIPGIGNLPCITSSDAHTPADIGKISTVLFVETPSFEEFHLALIGQNDRRIEN